MSRMPRRGTVVAVAVGVVLLLSAVGCVTHTLLLGIHSPSAERSAAHERLEDVVAIPAHSLLTLPDGQIIETVNTAVLVDGAAWTNMLRVLEELLADKQHFQYDGPGMPPGTEM